MNLPNKLSLTRIAALIVFCIAAFTDFLDGQIARRQHIVTTFGKFIDPVADKLLVLSTMIALCGLGEFPAWACIVVLFRELAVDGLRLVASQQGIVIAAGKLGKIKTTVQIVLILWLMLSRQPVMGNIVSGALTLLVLVMTLWSGVEYFRNNRSVISTMK